ncbi:MAG: GNAT family N-acetyltransferase [Actinomycetota bacterium]
MRARVATPEDTDTVAAVLAAAFADDPMLGWMFTDPTKAAIHRRQFFEISARSGIEGGQTHVLDDGGEIVATAVWSAPGAHLYGSLAGEFVGLLVLAAEGERAGLVGEGFAPLRDLHPEEPHFYLALLGVVPNRRGEGLGGRLLAAGLEVVDRFGAIAHLESSNPRNVSLYERAGFEVVEDVWLPDGPVVRPMTRPVA